ncbi:MAG: glycosyltransferase family 2 protein [Bacteroidales bacterium]|jgi:GT2 family glycosyltransferase|nr:glycosyltransferase family 2 protein [Bacteroidales bacterium]
MQNAHTQVKTDTNVKVATVILNWNGKHFLEKFLPVLLSCNTQERSEIIIADNASTDESVSFLKNNYPNIRIIENSFNEGFAGGYNTALKQVEAEYYILLNSDIEVTPHWIEPIIEMMDNDKKIAAVQPKILSYYEKEKFEYAGAAGGFIDYLGYPFCRGRIFANTEKDEHQYDNVCEIFWATGAAIFVRAEVYHSLGGLDRDFFAHQEEIDFCWRAKNNGYKIMYCPNSTIYHIGGGTLPKSSARKTYLNFRNNFALLYKNLPKNKFLKIFFLRFPLDILAAFSFLAKGNLAEFFAVFKAFRDFLKMRNKNKSNWSLLVRKDHLGQIYFRSLVLKHYLGRVDKFSQLSTKNFS